MTITKKLKAVLSLRGLTFADYARKLNIYPQALSNKAKKEVYTVKDLIEFGDLTQSTLMFVDDETGEILIKFNIEDLKEK